MTLVPDWKEVLRKAWSVRLLILAGVLSGLEVALPFFRPDIPRHLFAALSCVTVAAALIARVMAQRNLP